jgi:hypothetical protein
MPDPEDSQNDTEAIVPATPPVRSLKEEEINEAVVQKLQAEGVTKVEVVSETSSLSPAVPALLNSYGITIISVHPREGHDVLLIHRHALESQRQTQELQVAAHKAEHEIELATKRLDHELREAEKEAAHRRGMERWKAHVAFLSAWKTQITGGALVMVGVSLVLASHALVGNGVIGAGISLLAPRFKLKWK